ncbi:MmpS family transport accessory protein [Phytohabitans sp. LJ34]|uniref:MmpS family transport accessory protein n=1 Tax=Phytohabitans sp. LJ34 TaxID=3452217 RepID=UPI003F898AE1
MRRPRDLVGSLLLSGAAALWLAAAVATLFAGPQYARHQVDLQQDPGASTRTGLVLVAAVLLMMVAAGAAIAVAALGSIGSPVIRMLTWIFEAVAAVVAVVVMVSGAPAGVTWHARFMTGTAVLTLLLLAAAASFQLPSRRPAPRPAPAAVSPAPAAVSPAPTGSAGPAASPTPAPAGRAGFWRSAGRRDVPRWAVALAAAVALVFAAVAGLLGVRGAGPITPPSVPVAGAPASAAPPHDVIYTVSAPSTVTWMEIVYVDAEGKAQRTTSAPTGLPWVQPIRTGSRTDLLYLAVSVSSKAPNTKIQCAIHVDGRRAIASEGPSCNVHVRFP